MLPVPKALLVSPMCIIQLYNVLKSKTDKNFDTDDIH